MRYRDYAECMDFFGFDNIGNNHYSYVISGSDDYSVIRCDYKDSRITIKVYGSSGISESTHADINKAVKEIDHILCSSGVELFDSMTITDSKYRKPVLAAINTKNLASDLVRVRSSNVWAYGLNIKDRKDKTGDLVVQFKNRTGGPGDIYIYYDVPTILYRRWQSAPSKGHFFWVYIRNNYKYAKLTGDRKGKLPNAIN